ncbi:MAG: hypothetical protein SH847_10110 [Roseiflexaceae bacterium]|nr:hypothetical protein [Roseiflexaceae bacterium]
MLRWLSILISLLLLLVSVPSAAQETSVISRNVYLPMVITSPGPLSTFGFDLRSYYDDRVLSFAREANPRWVRAGDMLWSEVEPTPGVYNWAALEQVEANVRRLRQIGFEPIVIVQQSPAWAQREPGRLCSPPRPEYAGAFARFMQALAARYADGPTAIHYWEIWNEPDYSAAEVQDSQGFGCWARSDMPFYGGSYYGDVIKQVYPAVKAGNPYAMVLAGALAYQWPNDTVSREFLRGILASGAGNSFDALSFHAYGVWGAGDLLIAKTLRLRAILGEFGLAQKPLFATEIAATCYSARATSGGLTQTCPDDFYTQQANYAARIYAEAAALNLSGALWFSLVAANPQVIASAQLIDDQNGTLSPRPSFYSFRNSARLLQGATYIGLPPTEPTADQIDQVQTRVFRKGNNLLYVLWVPVASFPKLYNLPVPPGATAVCTDQLSRDVPATYYCSDTNGDGLIPRGVNELPQYIEIIGR